MGTRSVAQQNFTVSASMPILEIRTTLSSVLPYAEHFHSGFSLGLILEGRTRFSLGKEAYMAEAGDIVLIAPEQVHSCNPIGEMPRSYRMAHVDGLWFHEYLAMLLHQRRGLHIANPLIRDAELFAEAHDLLDNACSGADVEANLAALLIKMHTRHQCFLPNEDKMVRPFAENSIEQIMDYSISDLARVAGVRRESFSRSFRRATGLPPQNYLHCLRLEYGRNLLQKGSSIAEAAIASGYADQSHFHRMFVRYCSVTPGYYLKNQSHPYKK